MTLKNSLKSLVNNTKYFIEDAKYFLDNKINLTAKTTLGLMLGSYMFFNVNAVNAQVTVPVDSISVEYGHKDISKIATYIYKSLWEEKDGVPTLKDTIDFGNLPLGDEVPFRTFSSGYGVDRNEYSWDKWHKVVVIGTVFFSNGQGEPNLTKPVEGVGVNIYNAGNVGIFLGANYLEDRPIYTDENGSFSMGLRIKVRRKPVADSVVTVLNPNGGEVLKKGETYKIIFDQNYHESNFNAFYSADSGKTWYHINTNMDATDPSLKTFEAMWKVPNIDSDTTYMTYQIQCLR